MKYIAQVFSYLKKNGWLPLVVMLIPAIASAFLYTPFWEVSFVADYNYDPDVPMRLSKTFLIIFGDSWQYLWPVIIISVLQTVCAALVMSAIDRHFRSGKLSLRSPFRLINNSVFPMAIGMVIMCVVSLVWRIVLFGVVSLLQVIAFATHLNAGATLAIISVVAAALFIVHILIITPMLYWAPIMFMYGYKFRDAAGMSFKLLSGKKVFSGLLYPLLLCAGVQLLLGFLNVHVIIRCACNGVIFLFVNVYITVYVILTFYRISGLDRRDVPQYVPLPSVTPTQKSKSEQTVEDADKPSEQKPAAKKQAAKKQPPKKQTANNQSTTKSKTAKKSDGGTTGKKPKKSNSVTTAATEKTTSDGAEGGGDGV